MPARKANSSGKWSQNIWDITPANGDDVFANGFIVEIDQNINVGSLRTTLSSGYAVAGGGFTLYQPLSVIASPSGFLAGTTTCLTSYVSSGTAFLSANAYNTGAASNSSAILHNSNGNLTIVGSVTGARAAGSAASAHGISNASTGLISLIGEVHGGNQTSGGGATYGIYNAFVGTIVVQGDVFGGGTAGSASNHAIVQNSTGTLIINGTINASISANGVVSTNTLARNEFTGPFVNASNGRQAVYCARYLVTPEPYNSYTQMAGPSATNTPVFYYSPDSYGLSYVPPVSSVRSGVSYAAIPALSEILINVPTQLVGTMEVPVNNFVAAGYAVDDTVGTAIAQTENPVNLWNLSITAIEVTQPNTIGEKLINTLNTENFGNLVTNIYL